MNVWIARQLERSFDLRPEQAATYVNRFMVLLAALLFLILATVIVAFEDVFPSGVETDSLAEGSIAQQDIYAPQSITYTSDVLTEQRKEAARATARLIYETPDTRVARQQSELARQILDYIENIREDEFADPEQQVRDIEQISALDLPDLTIQQILEIDNDTWDSVDNQVMTVLEGIFQDEIRDTDVERIRSLLPTRVSVRFNEREAAVIAEIVSDLVRPNTSLDEVATEAERMAAANAVPVETRSFERGQIVVQSGTRITAVDYEALERLGLLRPAEQQLQGVIQAFLASLVVMVVTGLYVSRFKPSLMYQELDMLALVASIFLIVLLGARLGLIGQIFIYPTAAIGLLYVAIIGPEIAIIAVLGLALLVAIMAGGSLEIATYTVVGGIIGALTLRRSERLNSFFVAGLIVAVGNIAVIVLFNIANAVFNNPSELALLLVYGFFNGILTAAAALAGMYIITLIFNLPTALKLAELSQPNQPLLQRLLRDAPGTYQHSLQVANLSEQAANAVGANAELTHVAALYHDIGKMLNPAFFTENQYDMGNPHDILADPYRSADIIIGHVTGGDDLAKQYRLPNRIRDFIREHHGTSEVFVFYQQAVIQAGDDETMVDRSEFRYPGPRPQSRETALLMLADSCEAAVRSKQPKSKPEIEEIVHDIVDGKMKSGQLDESGLTLSDIKATRSIFVDILQGLFHPRINYSEAISKARRSALPDKKPPTTATLTTPKARKDETGTLPALPVGTGKKATLEADAVKLMAEKDKPGETSKIIRDEDDEEDTPMAEVPRLRRIKSTQEAPTPPTAPVQPQNGTETTDTPTEEEPETRQEPIDE